MGRVVLSFDQFIAESTEDHFKANVTVHQILLRNRDRIKDEANIDDYLFNKIVDDLSNEPPLSLDEEDVITDAIALAYMLKPEAIPYMKLDQGDRMSDHTSGKSGVAVQNYDNQGSGDSLG